MNLLVHAPYVGTSGYNSHCQNFFRNLSKYQNIKIRNFTVSKNWNGWDASNPNPHGEDVSEQDKSLIGLQTLWNSKGDLEDFEIYGFKRSKFNHDINIVLSEVNHYYFYSNYIGPKIAYTVWENTLYPNHFFETLKTYDQVWVPSKWQAEITINQGIPQDKVKIVPEGVDTSVFKYEDLQIDNSIFRFVIFGRWDARKSTREIIKAFKNVFGNNNKVELWISVDNPHSVDGLKTTEERLKKYNLESSNIKILHFPSREDYVKILKTSHVFLSCARSEGWNLPLIEAMACGIPSIYSNCSGQLEFAEGKGIPVKILKEISTKEIRDSYCENIDLTSGNWYEPDFNDLEKQILYSYQNYKQLKEKAILESKVICETFTWDNAAKKANEILNNFMNNYNKTSYSISFEGLSDDGKGILYKCSSDEDKKIFIQIVDQFSGTVFYENIITVNNKNTYFTSHAYKLANQTFKIFDYHTKELKLEHTINQSMFFDLNKLKIENKNLVSLLPKSIKFNSFVGFSFLEIFYRGTYSYKNCKINKGDVVFDLGSCFGLFSRYAFLNGAFQVHAFEPNKDLAESNLILNKEFNFFFNQKAVHSKNVEFNSKEDYIGSSVRETEGNNNLSINFNNYIKEYNIKKIDYLKIDIEGSEYDFFDTIDEGFLTNNIHKIALEYHDNINNKLKSITDKLTKCGFVYEFEFEEGKDSDLGMLYAWKSTGFNFNNFFLKYRETIEKSGLSRVKFYEYIIPKLVAKNKPLYILETGTMWAPLKDNMGAFTLIMADLIKNHTGGKLYTVDISEGNLNACKEYTKDFSDSIEYIQSDSVSYIKSLSDQFVFDLDLVYLDSWDFNLPQPHDSANHHLQEMLALYHRLNFNCPIAIDDNFLPNTWVMWNYFNKDGSIQRTERFETGDKILGKGMYCHEYLIKNDWTRFENFDVLGANNLFYYERRKLNNEKVSEILNNFYSSNKLDLPTTNKFLDHKNIKNSASGLGDALVLTALAKEKNIFSNFREFEELFSYTDIKFNKQESYFDVDFSDILKFNWGGGHCIQRLQKAFLGRCDEIPKPLLNKKCNPIKNKIAIHFESNKRAETKVPEEIQKLIFEFLKKENYEIYECKNSNNLNHLIDEMSTCEYFIGIDSGPMHVAAGLSIKSIILLNHPDSKNIYLPKLEEVNVANSEWLYPQNVHLAINEGNELVSKFSISNLKNALLGYLYPYFSTEYILSLKKPEVHIVNDSSSLGDFLAWTPIVAKYQREKQVTVNYYTPFKDLLKDSYPNVNFFSYLDKNSLKNQKIITLSCLLNSSYQSKNLQEIASDILNLPHTEERCLLPQSYKKENNFKKKYVCIAVQSTCQCKYWNHQQGWQKVVNYLKSLDYEVVCIDKYDNFGTHGYMNFMPTNCINKTGDLPLQDRINDLMHCEFFIGLSSGLSWLAWACNKPVVMISGFTDVWNEFHTKYRVINKNVCNSCWNDVNIKFDPSNWLWCPRNKDFECSKEITFEMVKEKIDQCIEDTKSNDINYLEYKMF